MAARAADPAPYRPGYVAAWPPVEALWLFGRGRQPLRPVWSPNRPPPERAPPYAPVPDDEQPRSREPAHRHSEVPIPGKVPKDARAQPDSTAERCSRAHPPRSDTLEPLPEKMFPERWNRRGFSTPGKYATQSAAARGSTGLCAHRRRPREEKPA